MATASLETASDVCVQHHSCFCVCVCGSFSFAGEITIGMFLCTRDIRPLGHRSPPKSTPVKLHNNHREHLRPSALERTLSGCSKTQPLSVLLTVWHRLYNIDCPALLCITQTVLCVLLFRVSLLERWHSPMTRPLMVDDFFFILLVELFQTARLAFDQSASVSQHTYILN